jgi:glucose uptake protein GlcU
MLIFPESSKNVAQNILPGNLWNKKNIFFFKWVNKIFWVAAILVGRSKRGNKQDFILSPMKVLLHTILAAIRDVDLYGFI